MLDVDSEQSSQHPTRSEGLFDVLQERKEPALRMAKDLWQEAGWKQLSIHAGDQSYAEVTLFLCWFILLFLFAFRKLYYKYLVPDLMYLVSLGAGMDQSCGAQWCLEAVYPIGLSSWMAMGTADLAAKRRCRWLSRQWEESEVRTYSGINVESW